MVHLPLSPSLPLFATLLPDAVSPARCEALCATLSARGFATTGGGYPAGYRDNDRLVLDDEALAKEIWSLPSLQRALGALAPLSAHGSTWRPVAANPRFRACRYEGGQSFTRHRDGAWLASEGRRTFLTAQLYLDDGFEGGATRFYAAREDAVETVSVTAQRGTIVLFDHRLWHDGEPVVRGRKHVLRTDIVFAREAPADGASALEPTRAVRDRYDFPGAPYVFALAAREDRTIAVGTREGLVTTLRRDDRGLRPTRTIALGKSSVTALAEDRRGRLFAGSRAGFVTSIDDQGVRIVWQTDSAITALSPIDDGILVATADGTVARLDREGDGVSVRVLARIDGWIWAIDPPTAGALDRRTWIASDRGLHALDADSGASSTIGNTPLRAVRRVAPGRMFTGDADGVVRGPGGETVASHRGAVTALVPDGAGGVVSGGEDGQLLHLRPASARPGDWDVRRFAAHDDFVRAIVVLADGTLVSGGYDGTVRAWPAARTPLPTE